jgi:hypothetical protein
MTRTEYVEKTCLEDGDINEMDLIRVDESVFADIQISH